MPNGDDTRNHPRRRIIRVYRDPLEEQREGRIKGKSYGPVVSRSEEEDKLNVAYVYSQYFNAEGDN